MTRRFFALALSVFTTVGWATAEPRSEPAEIPLDDLLTYRITWFGVHCGDMTLESRPVPGKSALVEIEMRVRSTALFDSVYEVRSMVGSLYDRRLGTTRRYHERSSEKGDFKDDLWVVQPVRGRARREKNGEVEIVEVPPQGVLDPLAMLYRIRALAEAPGEELSLTVMTTKGALEAKVSNLGWEQLGSGSASVPALKVVQEAVGDEEFGRGGSMTLWLSADARRVPYRIEFDLPFGSLVATLYDAAAAPVVEIDLPAPD